MSKFIDDKIKALQEGFNEYAQERHGKDGAVGMVVLIADEDTPLNVLRAAAEFATAMIKAGEAEGVHELTTCEHGVALPPNGCDGRCLACAGLKALKKLS